MIGSHLDTVPDAGRYDGVLGVVLGIALVESLGNRRLPFAIEIVGFSEEEGVRFGVPFIGSDALFNGLNDATLRITDHSGISVREAIRRFGLDPAQSAKPTVDPSAFAYLEFHIEQGPVLESRNCGLGVVEAIAGQSRARVTFQGKSNHAGTTPMHLRQDALAGAAEWITAVETTAHTTPGLVATVGNLEVEPGASNVIPGRASASLDVRHAEDRTRIAAFTELLVRAERIAARRGLLFASENRREQPAVAMHPELVKMAEDSLTAAGITPHRMASGAGHDAMIAASKLPTAMIFLRSPGGISHHPDESVRMEDVQSALLAGHFYLERLSHCSFVT